MQKTSQRYSKYKLNTTQKKFAIKISTEVFFDHSNLLSFWGS